MNSYSADMRERGLFVYETSNNRPQRFITLSLIIILIAVGVAVLVTNINLVSNVFAKDNILGGEKWYTQYVPDLVHNITPSRLLVISMIGSLIFFTLPVELAFLFSIIQGNSILLCIAVTLLGFALASFINYETGHKLSKYILYVLSAKKFYQMRRLMNRWGVYTIVLMTLLPTASDLLTFGLGTIKYNIKRLFALIIVGALVKFTIIALAANAILGFLR